MEDMDSHSWSQRGRDNPRILSFLSLVDSNYFFCPVCHDCGERFSRAKLEAHLAMPMVRAKAHGMVFARDPMHYGDRKVVIFGTGSFEAIDGVHQEWMDYLEVYPSGKVLRSLQTGSYLSPNDLQEMISEKSFVPIDLYDIQKFSRGLPVIATQTIRREVGVRSFRPSKN
jgi:hypothetical protein